MFTGLVEGIGEIVGLRRRGAVLELTIRSGFPAGALRAGDSVAVHGVCLTLVEDGSEGGTFRVQAVAETLRRTTLGRMRPGARLHLERAVRAGDRLGGHLVQGHVDGLGRIRRAGREGGARVLDVGLPRRWTRFLVEKGSICVDGVSLTIARLGSDWFRVQIVPATADATLLSRYRAGQAVNVEIDTVAKYVDSLLGSDRQSGSID